mmetsp:Transcript_74588/g.136299  ORF Transcript_74588/g.136299 Transcript_74588/m.136299 type:complete len:627 (-) Transcript_74588:36-1916(-)
MALRVTPLGAGRSVGRSCILVEISESRILLDCGVVPGGSRDFLPEFDATARRIGPLAQVLDAVVISHFHLDHIGALPYLTEVLGYQGPVLMTHPTRAIAPMILEDYIHWSWEQRNRDPPYSQEQLGTCFERVTCMQLHERCTIGDVSITPFYAGHVIGAVMILLECRGRSVLYTGDFTTVPDHHLSSARLPLLLRPDVMITETTYSTTIRSSKRFKEQELCRKMQETLEKGGKVLVPTFAIGRAQELCLLCEKHWARAKLSYPIYIGRGMVQKALMFFRLFASWSSDSVRKSENPFDFPHVQQFDTQPVVDSDTPMVLLAGQSMLNGGVALEVFKHWAPNPKNLVIIPGYCLPGTVGHQVQRGDKKVNVGEEQPINVNCQIEYMSHSDHTDARGILQLIGQVAPQHVVLVHGSESHMQTFQPIVQRRLRVPCYSPAVLETVDFSTNPMQEVLVTPQLLRSALPVHRPPACLESAPTTGAHLPAEIACASTFSGVLRKRSLESWELHDATPAGLAAAGLRAHTLKYRHEESKLSLSTFRECWAKLEPELRHGGTRHTWMPSALSAEGPILRGRTYTLAFLSVKCRLEASSGAALGDSPPKAKAVIEWTRGDLHSAAVVTFLEALGAG